MYIIILLYFFNFQEIHITKSLRIFSSLMTVGPDLAEKPCTRDSGSICKHNMQFCTSKNL